MKERARFLGISEDPTKEKSSRIRGSMDNKLILNYMTKREEGVEERERIVF